jgi:hypothetical protein
MRCDYFLAQGKRAVKNPKKTPAAGLSETCGLLCPNLTKSPMTSSRDGAGCFIQMYG